MYTHNRNVASIIYTGVLLMILVGCQESKEEPIFTLTTYDNMLPEIEEMVTGGILEKWYPLVIDETHGGYLSNFDYDWSVMETQEKMIVTQARHLWTAVEAAKFLPEDDRYVNAAKHGAPWLINEMWDDVHGGFFQMTDREGHVLMDNGYRDEKRAYGIAFGIYGLAAYADYFQDSVALGRAVYAFQWLETYSHDSIYGGYFQSLSREGEVLKAGYNTTSGDREHFGLKDYNSSIHLLEALAELHRAWPDSLCSARLEEMLLIVRDTITTSRGYMELFFFPDWSSVSYRYSDPQEREENYHMDHVSPGHDIETAFLLLDAAESLGKRYDETLTIAKKMVDHTLETGFDHEKGGFFERGYYMPDEDTITIIDERKNWWAQAEGLHTLILFSELYPDQVSYREAAEKQWDYIKNNIYDSVHGGWYSQGIDVEPEYKTRPKGNVWKSAYHNGRALIESIELLRKNAES